MSLMQRKLDKLAHEAATLRKPQKHDYEWFRRIDRLLDQVKLLPKVVSQPRDEIGLVRKATVDAALKRNDIEDGTAYE